MPGAWEVGLALGIINEGLGCPSTSNLSHKSRFSVTASTTAFGRFFYARRARAIFSRGYTLNQADMAVEAAKIAPAAPVTVMAFMGYNVADWASAATLAYVLGLIAHGLWAKVIRPWRRSRGKGG